MKKLLLTLGTAASIAAPIATTVACGSGGAESVTLKGIGSNSVTPVTNDVTANTIYTLDYTNSGSSNGARGMSAAELEYDFGMMSSRKSPTISGETDNGAAAEKNWEDNNVRTVTYAIDSIGIHVNLPASIETHLDGDAPIVLVNELSKLYDTDTTNNDVTWDQLLDQDLAGASVADADTTIAKAIGVTGGKDVSGKSEAFVAKITDSADNHEGMGGHFLGTPDEAAPLFNGVKDNENSVGYHSLGFLEAQSDAIIADIKWDSTSVVEEAETENAQGGTYTWIRPFNVAFSIDNTDAVEFVDFLLSEHYQAEIAKLGFVPLSNDDTDNQLKLQTETYPFTGDDAVADYGTNGANSDADLDFGLVL